MVPKGALILGSILAASACGGAQSPEAAAPTPPTTVAPTTVALTTIAPTTVAPVTQALAPAQQQNVPNVVGQDHQFAQDTLQAAGFYGLTEEDASGRARLLVLDRNWKVCSQSPPGGTKASTDAVIILKSVKDEETCP